MLDINAITDQTELNEYIKSISGKTDTKELIQEFVLGIIKNSTNILEEIDWQSQRPDKGTISLSNVEDHIVDIMKYLISVMLEFDIDTNGFEQLLIQKSLVIRKKIDYDKFLNGVRRKNKTIAFDIDDVIANFRKTFIYYLEKRGFDIEGLEELQHYSLFKNYSITHNRAEQIKHESVGDGIYSALELIDDNIPLIISNLYERFNVVFLTSRPYPQYRRILKDTIFFLDYYNIKCDCVVFGREKTQYLENDTKVVAFFEDHPKHAIEMASHGIKTFVMKMPYNVDYPFNNKKIKLINNWNEIKTIVNKIKE